MKIKLLFLSISIIFALPVQAYDLGNGLNISGFGTLGVLNSSDDSADYLSNPYFQAVGAGRSEDTTVKVDSKVALQLEWKATDYLSFTGQTISKQYADNSWYPQLEWAFVKFKILPTLEVRGGRIRPAIYMLSDYLDVNYANPWVRPPVEFYSLAPISRMEGIDFLWRPTTGKVSWLVQPYFGITTHLSSQNNAYLETENILGINISASLGDFTLRAGFVQGDMTLYVPTYENQVKPALQALCVKASDPVACEKLNELDPHNKDSSFGSLGISWDDGDYFISGEYGKRNTKSYLADATSWYVTGGARFKSFTPYITYSSFKNDDHTQLTGAQGNLGKGITTNNLVTQLLQRNFMDQSTITLGVRYDVIPDLALKFQWDHVETSPKSGQAGTGGGLFFNQQSDFNAQAHTIDLLSVSCDFTF